MKDLSSKTREEIVAEIKRVETAIKTTKSAKLRADYTKYVSNLHHELRRRCR